MRVNRKLCSGINWGEGMQLAGRAVNMERTVKYGMKGNIIED